MSREYEAKQVALKAYPNDTNKAIELFLEYLDISESDFIYDQNETPLDYIFNT